MKNIILEQSPCAKVGRLMGAESIGSAPYRHAATVGGMRVLVTMLGICAMALAGMLAAFSMERKHASSET